MPITLLPELVSVDADVTGMSSSGTQPERPPGRAGVRSRPADRALHLTLVDMPWIAVVSSRC